MEQNWVEMETAGCDLGDSRLNRRLGAILQDLGERPGTSLPTAFEDWSNTKAAYRFFSNGNVSEDKILEGHFAASALRIKTTEGPILILQDTTARSFLSSAAHRRRLGLPEHHAVARWRMDVIRATPFAACGCM